MSYNYEYLNTFDGANSVESTDANGKTVWSLDSGENWNTVYLGVSRTDKVLSFKIIPDSIVDTGTLTYEYSIDGINWSTVVTASGDEVEFDISNTLGTVNLTDTILNGNYRRFTNSACTSGTIKIEFTRGN